MVRRHKLAAIGFSLALTAGSCSSGEGLPAAETQPAPTEGRSLFDPLYTAGCVADVVGDLTLSNFGLLKAEDDLVGESNGQVIYRAARELATPLCGLVYADPDHRDIHLSLESADCINFQDRAAAVIIATVVENNTEESFPAVLGQEIAFPEASFGEPRCNSQ
ncbi:MAG TPA: hypothetical protein PKB09_01925 [Candidatus Saccharibacteria bacterium]|nr:hypothetical protein [Candidatus Saccharibacteria bacterium]